MTDQLNLLLVQRLKQAVYLHHIGNLQEAEHLYLEVLHEHPHHPDANYNLGMLVLENKRVEESLFFFKAALEASPQEEVFWISYIDALIQAGHYTEAELVLSYGSDAGLSQKEIASFMPFKVLPFVFSESRDLTGVAQSSYCCQNGLTVLGKSRLVFDTENHIVFVDGLEVDSIYRLMADFFFHDELFKVIGYDVMSHKVFFKRTYAGSYLRLDARFHLKGKWLSLLHHASENWMHWLSEVLPKLYVSNSPLDDFVGLIVDADLPDSINQTLQLLAPNRCVYKVKAHEFVHVDELVIPTTAAYSLFWKRTRQDIPAVWKFDRTALKRMRSGFLELIGNEKSDFQLIYSQRKASFRHIKNEEALKLMLDELGFTTINTGAMTAFDQIEVFKNCKLLVSQAGAAMANMVFMPIGSIAIVLALDSAHIDYDYFDEYASIFGVSIIYLKCKGADPEKYYEDAVFSVKHPTNQDIICDLKQLCLQMAAFL